MERVAFLIEETNERIGCLLNPATVVIRRTAGVRPRQSLGGALTGPNLTDDPLLQTGGGHTELDLELLFDCSLAGSSIATDDVRDLTGPLWHLAENRPGPDGRSRLRVVRFVWGKAWNIPGVVSAVAERFERFTATGLPQRSWLSLQLWRVSPSPASIPPGTPSFIGPLTPAQRAAPASQSHLVLGAHTAGPTPPTGTTERLDLLATRYAGSPGAWKALAEYNDLTDPLRLPAGQLLRIPDWFRQGGNE